MAEEDPSTRAGRRAKRAMVVFLAVLASVFVVSTTWQIVRAVFDLTPQPVATAPGTSDDCAHRIRALEAALDRGSAAATREKDEASASAAFDRELLPEWSQSDQDQAVCGREPNGTAAYAALLQLKKGLEGRARHDASTVGALRRALHERIP